jgi:hypothetical protein
MFKETTGDRQEAPSMTREEHLQWCKKRALRYIDAGELSNACTSMMSDLSKHPDTKDHMGLLICPLYTTDARSPRHVRDWIEGFQ